MKHRLIPVVGVFLPVFLMASIALAAADKASRPATKKDVVGVWELVSVHPVLDSRDPVYYPYQRFVFNANATMKYMVSDKPFKKEWLDKFSRQVPEIDFRVDRKGILSLMWQKKPHQESVICAYVLQNVPADVLAKVPADKRKALPKKGNLTLSFLNNEGKISYQKVLTRVA